MIDAALAEDLEIEVEFRETTTICVERPAGTGEAVELLYDGESLFSATVGLRVEPAPARVRGLRAGNRLAADAPADERESVEPGRAPRAHDTRS